MVFTPVPTLRYYRPSTRHRTDGLLAPEEVRALAEDTYGKVPRVAEVGERKRPMEPQQIAARTVTLADPLVTQQSLRRYYLAPSEHMAEGGVSEALDVLSCVLGKGTNSRLYQTLVVDKKVALSANAANVEWTFPPNCTISTARWRTSERCQLSAPGASAGSRS